MPRGSVEPSRCTPRVASRAEDGRTPGPKLRPARRRAVGRPSRPSSGIAGSNESTGGSNGASVRAIREIVERNVELLALKPSRGHLTCTTRARLADGLRCEIEEGPWRLAADLPAKVGGEETAPTPGVLGRAALAGCLTIGIAHWAARLGVPIGEPRGRGRGRLRRPGRARRGRRHPARVLGGPLRGLDRQPGSQARAGRAPRHWPSATAPTWTCSAGRSPCGASGA